MNAASENCRSYLRFNWKKIADKMTSAVKQKVKKKKTKQIKGKKSTYQQKKDNKLFMI